VAAIALEEVPMAVKRWMSIRFNDASEMRFEFPKQTDDTTNIVTGINKMLKGDHLLVDVEGVLYTFPFANIKYIRVSPLPPKLPDTAIMGAVLSEH
jgi:hypothetical protein